jgi:succinyl-CoA synthetase beta subunit
MKLHEVYSKRIFAKYGIPIPDGDLARTASEAEKIAKKIGFPVVIKSQVLVGGRGKAGGIKVAKNAKEAKQHAQDILELTIKDLPVRMVLVDQAADIKTEIYLGITNDRAARKPVMMASSAGGVDIEEVARETPGKIIKCHIDPLMGLQSYQSRDLAAGIDLSRNYWR